MCIENIRAGRKKPGLLRQHLACLKAASEICDAKVTGDHLGSQKVTFAPGKVKAGEYTFAVGSAGSTTLIFQTVFPALAMQNEISEITLEGGTHNGMAPSFDFIQQCFIPTINPIGYTIGCSIERYGFYPSGGGKWRARIYPRDDSQPLDLVERGKTIKQEAQVTQAKIPHHVAERELAYLNEKYSFKQENLTTKIVQSVGPGNIVSIRFTMDELAEVFESVGERNVSAERVAGRAMAQLRHYLSTDAPVGEYLADQLLVPMVLGNGGRFRTCEFSEHLSTNISVVEQLTQAAIEVDKKGESDWVIQVRSHS